MTESICTCMPCKSDAQHARTVRRNCKHLAHSQSLLCCTLPVVPLWLGHVLQGREEGLGSLLLAHLFAATFTTLSCGPRLGLARAWLLNHSQSAISGGAVRAGTHIPSCAGLCCSWLCFGALTSAMLPVLGQSSTLCAFANAIRRVNAQRSNLGAFGSAILSVSLQRHNWGAFGSAILRGRYTHRAHRVVQCARTARAFLPTLSCIFHIFSGWQGCCGLRGKHTTTEASTPSSSPMVVVAAHIPCQGRAVGRGRRGCRTLRYGRSTEEPSAPSNANSASDLEGYTHALFTCSCRHPNCAVLSAPAPTVRAGNCGRHLPLLSFYRGGARHPWQLSAIATAIATWLGALSRSHGTRAHHKGGANSGEVQKTAQGERKGCTRTWKTNAPRAHRAVHRAHRACVSH